LSCLFYCSAPSKDAEIRVSGLPVPEFLNYFYDRLLIFLTNLGSRNPTMRSVQAEFIKLNEVSVAPSTAPIERTIAVEDLHFYLINVDQDKKYVSRIFAITSKTVAKLENYL
jgi:hypothetical protein